MTTSLQPVTESNREQSLDTLRGFAIVGVLFALFTEWENFGIPPGNEQSISYIIINKAAVIFLHGKAYNLLAFLFGYGFALQVSRARRNNIKILPFAIRRALGLFVLGTLHAILLRDGDILAPYAICSLFVILLRNCNNRVIIFSTLIALCIPTFYFLIRKWTGMGPVQWGMVQDVGLGLIEKNLAYLLQRWYPHIIEIHSLSLLLFLVGMYASRLKWLEKIQKNPKQLNILFATGLILYLLFFFIPWKKLFPATVDFSSSYFYKELLFNFLNSSIKLPLSWGIDLVYISLILHLRRNNTTGKILKPLTNMGKMALTNYLLPDIFFIPIFLVIFDLYSKVTAMQQILMATAFAIFLGWFSTWWLKRYNFGPFEWLLRSFTYWKWQQLKKKAISKTTEMAF